MTTTPTTTTTNDILANVPHPAGATQVDDWYLRFSHSFCAGRPFFSTDSAPKWCSCRRAATLFAITPSACRTVPRRPAMELAIDHLSALPVPSVNTSL
jgi:hypothetical protein